MDEPEERRPEAVFEIVWRQRDSGEWVAEVKDTRTDQRRQVSSLEELEQFIRSRLHRAGTQRRSAS